MKRKKIRNESGIKQYSVSAGIGDGHGVTVWTCPQEERDIVMVRLERKIKPEDVVDGKLTSTVFQEVKRRGGKRHASFMLSYEKAVALHGVLASALDDLYRKRLLSKLVVTEWTIYPSSDK